MLGTALLAGGKLDEAIDELREAIREQLDGRRPVVDHTGRVIGRAYGNPRRDHQVAPDDPHYHVLGVVHPLLLRRLLSIAYRERGDFAGALAVVRDAQTFIGDGASYFPQFEALVAETERMAALADRLPAALKGETPGRVAHDLQVLATMAFILDDYAASARLSAEAMEIDPKLAGDLRAAHRYNAACAAALAGCGKGQDNPPADAAAWSDLRGRALEWLRADLALRAEQLQADAAEARRALAHWKRDPDLAGVRDPDALATLPEPERADWQALWAEVDRLLQNTGEAP
jgi:hypothetical protein